MSEYLATVKHNADLFKGFSERGFSPIYFTPLKGDVVKHSFQSEEQLLQVRKSFDVLADVAANGVTFGTDLHLPPLATVLATQGESLNNLALMGMMGAVLSTAIVRPDVAPALSASLGVAGGSGISVASQDLYKFQKTAVELLCPRPDYPWPYHSQLGETLRNAYKQYPNTPLFVKVLASDGSSSLKDYHTALRANKVDYDSQFANHLYDLYTALGPQMTECMIPDFLLGMRRIKRRAYQLFYEDDDVEKGTTLLNFFLNLQMSNLMDQPRFRAIVTSPQEMGKVERACLGRAVASLIYQSQISSLDNQLADHHASKVHHKLSSLGSSMSFYPGDEMKKIFELLLSDLEKADHHDIDGEQLRKDLLKRVLEQRERRFNSFDRQVMSNAFHFMFDD